MITIEDFGDFFEAVHGAGKRPFSWQEDLLRHVVNTGTWPEQIVAPTGAGKSSVVEIHVFAVALFAACPQKAGRGGQPKSADRLSRRARGKDTVPPGGSARG